VKIGLALFMLAGATSLPAQSAPDMRGVAGRGASNDRYDDAFRKYTKRFFGPAFDWHYFKAQGMAESDLIPTAKSRVGAKGIMQLMPSTFKLIRTARPEFASIDDPEWNIAAGIMHDRYLWTLWQKNIPESERHRFMFASYNAGEGTINRARAIARTKLGDTIWSNIEQVAPTVQRWRYLETLGYVRRIDSVYAKLVVP
jgi:membrane-bound lytic murein transglycosylase F